MTLALPAPETLDTARWPGLDRVPTGPRARIAAALAKRIFTAAIRRLPVTVITDEGTLGGGGPEMTLHRPEEFFARLGRDGLIGFGESYLTGAWDAEDLGGFLTVLAAEVATLVPEPMQRLRAAYVRRPPRHQKNSTDNTRTNIAHHYDLSNDLFALFLDPTLSYSSALFEGEVSAGDKMDLADAQARKIERLLDASEVGQGTRVLEIGTGWGELALRAARRGAIVHSVTLSSEQKRLAEQRIAEAGYADRVTVELTDYRAVRGEYDVVLSVEMIEAVGFEYWPTYFRTVDELLVPGGRFGLQAITMPHDRMLATRHTWTWINKYIFPGGFLPSVQAIEEITTGQTSLRTVDRLDFGADYAETLRHWDDAFIGARGEVRQLGFDQTFLRMWHFYLEYSRAGFASGYIDVNQFTFRKEAA